jgi:RimJ/RimL family protein N-acetyltransferase
VRTLLVEPRFRIKRTDDIDEVRDLALQCFTDGELEREDEMEAATWWLCLDPEGDPAGFIGARIYTDALGACAYLSLVGVLPHARGSRLMQRLVRTMLRWAKREGCYVAVTYVHPLNAASMRGLLRSGFQPYTPETPWVGDEWVYLRAPLAPVPAEPAGPVH